MWLAIDAHVHIYPCFQADAALRRGYDNLKAAATLVRGVEPAKIRYVIALAERGDCYWYRSVLRSGGLKFQDCTIVPGVDGRLLEVRFTNGASLSVLPGRQVSSEERLEWICFGVDADLPERAPWRDLLHIMRSQGGIPTLNWAPGKWMGARRRIVEEVLGECHQEIMMCDTTLRPCGWGTPVLMRRGAHQGVAIVRGSDALPNPGEEKLIGTYGSLLEWNQEQELSPASLWECVRNGSVRVVGRRSSPWGLFMRLTRYYAGGKNQFISTANASGQRPEAS